MTLFASLSGYHTPDMENAKVDYEVMGELVRLVVASFSKRNILGETELQLFSAKDFCVILEANVNTLREELSHWRKG